MALVCCLGFRRNRTLNLLLGVLRAEHGCQLLLSRLSLGRAVLAPDSLCLRSLCFRRFCPWCLCSWSFCSGGLCFRSLRPVLRCGRFCIPLRICKRAHNILLIPRHIRCSVQGSCIVFLFYDFQYFFTGFTQFICQFTYSHSSYLRLYSFVLPLTLRNLHPPLTVTP